MILGNRGLYVAALGDHLRHRNDQALALVASDLLAREAVGAPGKQERARVLIPPQIRPLDAR
jgi:hypothetical protein